MATWAGNLKVALERNALPIQREEWRQLLYERFRERPLPLLVSELGTIPAASIWTGSRIWIDAFRSLGLTRGQRVVLALPPSPAFLQVLLAGIWQELTIVFAPETVLVDSIMQQVDACCAVALNNGDHVLIPNGVEGPGLPPPQLRSTNAPPAPEVRFMLRTSGSTGSPKWIALSDKNILSVLASHAPEFELEGARVLSVLPWSHAFGLVIDLLSALFSGSEIIRDPSGGRDPNSILAYASSYKITHMSAVPLTIKRLVESQQGRSFLCSLRGGIVGGAPVSKGLAAFLEQTQLRSGYGQTEASPGIALGKPGIWRTNQLGQPLGCEVRIDDHGELWFQGNNAHYGSWDESGLQVYPADRWVATGDRVEEEDDTLIYRGRLNDRFKLENGRMIEAGSLETILRESISAIDDALLYTADGEHLNVLIRSIDEQCHLVDEIKSCLGSLSKFLDSVHVVREEVWIRTRKGDIAREATLEAFKDTELFTP